MDFSSIQQYYSLPPPVPPIPPSSSLEKDREKERGLDTENSISRDSTVCDLAIDYPITTTTTTPITKDLDETIIIRRDATLPRNYNKRFNTNNSNIIQQNDRDFDQVRANTTPPTTLSKQDQQTLLQYMDKRATFISVESDYFDDGFDDFSSPGADYDLYSVDSDSFVPYPSSIDNPILNSLITLKSNNNNPHIVPIITNSNSLPRSNYPSLPRSAYLSTQRHNSSTLGSDNNKHPTLPSSTIDDYYPPTTTISMNRSLSVPTPNTTTTSVPFASTTSTTRQINQRMSFVPITPENLESLSHRPVIEEPSCFQGCLYHFQYLMKKSARTITKPFSKLKKWFSKKQSTTTDDKKQNKNRRNKKVLLVGLDGAGKTSILYKMKIGVTVETVNTLGILRESVQFHDLCFDCVDIGGADNVRNRWDYHLQDASAVIFVMDGSDASRLEETEDELCGLIRHRTFLKKLPFLVFLNKCDAIHANVEAMEFERILKGIKHKVVRCSAMTGEGLEEGFGWLVKHLRRRK